MQNFTEKRWLPAAVIFLLAILLYANSLCHDFVLDDSMMISRNQFTTKGLAGLPGIFTTDMFYGFAQNDFAKGLVVGGRYRPMSLALFATIHQFFGENPLPYHLATVFLYGLTCVVLFFTLRKIFGEKQHGNLLAFLATLLYTTHPLHSEVVNNVKSCDEILTMLFSLLAMWAALKAAENQSFKWIVAAGLAFLFAAFSKENSTPFVLLIPLVLWLKFSEKPADDSPEQPSVFSKIVKICLPIWAAFLVFFVVRGAVIGYTFGAAQLNLINNPFIKFNGAAWEHFSAAEKFATIIFCLGKYGWLHLLPHPLTTDYYPRHIGIENFGNVWVWASLLFNAALFLFATIRIFKGKLEPISFGLFFYFSTIFLASNIVFPVGTNMAERFTFMPSAGICLALAGILIELSNRRTIRQSIVWSVSVIVVLFFSIKIISRNPDFSDSKTLLFTDVKTSPNSAKLQCSVAGILIREAMESQDSILIKNNMAQAVKHLDKSLENHPTYSEALFARGTAHYFLKNYAAAIPDLQKTLQQTPGRPEVIQNLAACYLDAAREIIESEQNAQAAFPLLSQANQLIPNSPDVLFHIALAHLKLGNLSQAVPLLEKLQQMQPGNPEISKALQKARAGNSK